MRCSDCSGGSPSSSCSEMVTTCGEGNHCGFPEHKPQPGLGQSELSENRESSVSPFSPALSCFQNLGLGRWCRWQSKAVYSPSGSWHQAPQQPAVCCPSGATCLLVALQDLIGPFTHTWLKKLCPLKAGTKIFNQTSTFMHQLRTKEVCVLIF